MSIFLVFTKKIENPYKVPKTLQIGQEMKKKSTDSKKIPIFSQIIEFEGLSYTILFKTEKIFFIHFGGLKCRINWKYE